MCRWHNTSHHPQTYSPGETMEFMSQKFFSFFLKIGSLSLCSLRTWVDVIHDSIRGTVASNGCFQLNSNLFVLLLSVLFFFSSSFLLSYDFISWWNSNIVPRITKLYHNQESIAHGVQTEVRKTFNYLNRKKLTWRIVNYSSGIE